MRFSINCLAVICLPTVIYAIMRESTSEIYAPGSILHHISFRSTILVSYLFYFAIFTFQSIQQKYQKYLSYYLYIYPIEIIDLSCFAYIILRVSKQYASLLWL